METEGPGEAPFVERAPFCPVSHPRALALPSQARKHLEKIDAVMIGRSAYHEPWNILGGADVEIFGEAQPRVANRCDPP